MTPPRRRIAELVLVVEMPREVRPGDRVRLEEVARTCPVALSLHPDVAPPWSSATPRPAELGRPVRARRAAAVQV